MWIGVGNLIQQGTRESHHNLSMEQQTTNDGLKEQSVAIKQTNMGNCMPRGSKTMKSNQLLCGRGVPQKDVGLEKGSFLKPYLADYNYI